jgi:hypothetical protein
VSDQEVKDALERSSRDPVRRILFTGGSVVTMDPAIGDLSKGDVIVDGSRIVDVGSDLCSLGAADDAIVIDATGGRASVKSTYKSQAILDRIPLPTRGKLLKEPYIIAVKEETMKNGSGAQWRREIR